MTLNVAFYVSRWPLFFSFLLSCHHFSAPSFLPPSLALCVLLRICFCNTLVPGYLFRCNCSMQTQSFLLLLLLLLHWLWLTTLHFSLPHSLALFHLILLSACLLFVSSSFNHHLQFAQLRTTNECLVFVLNGVAISLFTGSLFVLSTHWFSLLHLP